jgi:hypothetical protein
VALVGQVPPAPSSPYAEEGTLLHNAIAAMLEGAQPEVSPELMESKLTPALAALDYLDPFKDGEIARRVAR